MSGRANSSADMPPTEPASEERVGALAEDFLAECRTAVAELKIGGDWEFKGESRTISPAWGDIWRRDFLIPADVPVELVNRIICWRGPNGRVAIAVAIGQDIAAFPQ